MESGGSKRAESSADGARRKVSQKAADGNGGRCWDMLNPEILALIFTRIPADELVRAVPFVCRGWRDAVAGPYCWADIDIAEWCQRVDESDVIDAVVRKLVRRSRYTIRRLSAYRIGNWGFSLTASFGIHLRVLEIPNSDVNDTYIEKYSGTLTALEELDISFCHNITARGIGILGKNCTSLIHLRRNLTALHFLQNNGAAAKISEDEALAVANTMPGLQKLQLSNGLFTDYGLNAILNNCKALSSLVLSGCSKLKLAGDLRRRCSALEYFADPSYDEYLAQYVSNTDDDDGDDEEEEELPSGNESE